MNEISPEDYGRVAEELVFKYLQDNGENPRWVKQASGNVGDITVDDKIIEVKGQSEDWDAMGDEDRVRSSIEISNKEYDFMMENPELFEVYVVYRLKHNENPEYNKPKIAICKGTDLKNIKPIYKNVQLRTSYAFWKKIKPITLDVVDYIQSTEPRI